LEIFDFLKAVFCEGKVSIQDIINMQKAIENLEGRANFDEEVNLMYSFPSFLLSSSV